MDKKNIIILAVTMVLFAALLSVSRSFDGRNTVHDSVAPTGDRRPSEGAEDTVPTETEAAADVTTGLTETDPTETEASTEPEESTEATTEATQPEETAPPVTDPPETQPPETTPPATQPPATMPPETQPPTEPPTESQPDPDEDDWGLGEF